MKVKNASSPNFGNEEIPVEFLVLHYTACSLEDTLRIFSTPEKTCAHFVLDRDGTVYDLGNFLSAPIRRGAHAGVSSFELAGKKWEGLNGFSIGIEIVNFNGNVIPYPDAQYEGLFELVRQLGGRFPALRDPNRVVGHEQIAGFRGKVDPGSRFDWNRLFDRCFPGATHPERQAVLDPKMMKAFEKTNGPIRAEQMSAQDWSLLSSKLETFVAGLRKP